MKQNLVGKILDKVKIFVQDFVTIVMGIRKTKFLAYIRINNMVRADDSSSDELLLLFLTLCIVFYWMKGEQKKGKVWKCPQGI